MKVQEALHEVLIISESVLVIIERVLRIFRTLTSLKAKPPAYSYENLLLEFSLDLKDRQGKHAVITRRQRVHFFTAEAGVLSSPVWGEGSQLKRYWLNGARRLGIRLEGSRRVLLLGLAQPSQPDMVTQVASEQTVANAFLKKREYFEAIVERPTKRLIMRALFPKGRPPTEASVSVNSTPKVDRLPIRLGKDGRARLSYSVKQPSLNTVYSMRWAW
jgi:hypothetical protein